jgi:hypothetical protein
MKNSDPSIGYSIAYPFGVIVPILCIYFMTHPVQPNSRGFSGHRSLTGDRKSSRT